MIESISLCRHRALSFLLLAAVVLTVQTSSAVPQAGKHRLTPKPKPVQTTNNPASTEPVRFADEKPFAEMVKEMETISGLFTFYRKGDENKYYLEILPEQLDKVFLFSGTVDQSVGEKGLYSSQMGGEFPFYFKLVGKQLQWRIKNSGFSAQDGTPSARATARSFSDGILASTKVISQLHPERKSILINLSELILFDLPYFAGTLKEVYKPSDYRFDRNSSTISQIKAFPENVLLDLNLHYISDNPKTGSLTLPDTRSIPIILKYDLSKIRESSYKPRAADDRVGHFLVVHNDFTSDRASTPHVRRINRWNLEKADPSAPLSAPKQPIVFWLENTIPLEYRDAMKEGALLWNDAFEKIGFKDAIVVKQQPDDATWDAADTRYNTIRWFVGVDAAFAIGPSRVNPFTGEIYDADIGFSEGIVRFARRQGEEFVTPLFPKAVLEPAQPPKLAWNRCDRNSCEIADGLEHQASLSVNLLEARGALTPQMEEKLVREFLISITAHEVGHTLGLRHNFRASTLLKPEQLNDTSITSGVGQSGSVMDYNAMVIAGENETQGHFMPVKLGPYDYWAVEYAYKTIEKDEPVELAKIASRAATPELAYSTDEDALGTFSPAAIDPLVNQWDHSSDPLRFFTERVRMVGELWKKMDTRLLKEGEGYQVLRRAVGRGLNEYARAFVTATKFIGGIYHYRDHYGDPNGRFPYIPVPAVKQKEALDFLQRTAFSEDSFALPASVHNKLAVDRLPGFDGYFGLINNPRVDFPWHDSVLNIQKSVLARLYQPLTLARILDNELRFENQSDSFQLADLFEGIDRTIWSELSNDSKEISSLRRNLQREHVKTLGRLALRTVGGVPEDATSLARSSLISIQEKATKALADEKISDRTSRAHLEETRERIESMLQARLAKNFE
ncbi:MAG: zinc-dependent metalloprotease [Verrucomicrobiota bacterium]|nr:zinc-dependent metalloprotease [Verrucomicrobiota bacterium]